MAELDRIERLIERMRDAYTAWNNPPSDGLPDGAGIVLDAADALAHLRAERDELRKATIEECARAYEAHDKTNRDWMPGSLWDSLNREAANRVRTLLRAAGKVDE